MWYTRQSVTNRDETKAAMPPHFLKSWTVVGSMDEMGAAEARLEVFLYSRDCPEKYLALPGQVW